MEIPENQASRNESLAIPPAATTRLVTTGHLFRGPTRGSFGSSHRPAEKGLHFCPNTDRGIQKPRHGTLLGRYTPHRPSIEQTGCSISTIADSLVSCS